MFRPRSNPVAILILVVAALMPAAVQASAVCDRLQLRLANLPQIVVSNANAGASASAISRRNIELRRARNDMRRMGCSGGSIIVIGGENAGECRALEASIAQMQDEIDTMKSQRRLSVSGTDRDDTRRRVLAALDLNGCNRLPAGDEQVAEVTVAPEEETHRNILRDLPQAGSILDLPGSEMDDGGGIISFSLPGEIRTGGLRTLCVRTCDGAFFPISSSASPADFPRDAAACAARCPGTATELYYHALETQETDEMISAITGQPYSTLPAAFTYRTRDLREPGQCSCGQATARAAPATTVAPTTTLRPATGPVLDDIGLKGPQTLEAKAPVRGERPYDPGNSKIRVVGPTYLPAEESAIDLRNPAGSPYQPVQNN